eukprot:gb/GECG01009555.1/.p1 GENE.gb/GECG01009555.1/~~gb/GECG01009555.1/.p1  ORF type:complete len:147 (+),score=20.04 gb/GECG01009555.1/:1-441(+)
MAQGFSTRKEPSSSETNIAPSHIEGQSCNTEAKQNHYAAPELVQRLEQLQPSTKFTDAIQEVRHVPLSEQALSALNLYTRDKSSSVHPNITVENKEDGKAPRGFYRGPKFERIKSEATSRAESVIRNCRQWPHKGCWRQEDGDPEE